MVDEDVDVHDQDAMLFHLRGGVGEQFATFGKKEVYNQKHAEGFIRLLSLPERIRAMKEMGG